jgi:hypothetical protein
MSDISNENKFKVGDIVTIKHGLGDEYCLSFRIDAGKRCRVVEYADYGHVRIRILDPTKKELCEVENYHWATAEETLELVNRQLTFVFSD